MRPTMEGGELGESKGWRFGSNKAPVVLTSDLFQVIQFHHHTLVSKVVSYTHDPLCSLSLGPLGGERLHRRRSKTGKGQKCKGEDACTGVRGGPHTHAQQRHAQTLGAPQVVLAHQGTVPARRRISGGCVWSADNSFSWLLIAKRNCF